MQRHILVSIVCAQFQGVIIKHDIINVASAMNNFILNGKKLVINYKYLNLSCEMFEFVES